MNANSWAFDIDIGFFDARRAVLACFRCWYGLDLREAPAWEMVEAESPLGGFSPSPAPTSVEIVSCLEATSITGALPGLLRFFGRVVRPGRRAILAFPACDVRSLDLRGRPECAESIRLHFLVFNVSCVRGIDCLRHVGYGHP